MTLLLICKVVLNLWLNRKLILHHIFKEKIILFHINILIIRIRGIGIGIDIIGMMTICFIILCKRGVKEKNLDQFQLQGLIVMGLMNGHGRVWNNAWGPPTNIYHWLYNNTILLFLVVDPLEWSIKVRPNICINRVSIVNVVSWFQIFLYIVFDMFLVVWKLIGRTCYVPYLSIP
jgi:hypothetical protein